MSLSDAALGRLLDLLETKVMDANGRLVKVDRFFAFSKMCANCGYKHDNLLLSDRVFVCPNCHLSLDRDHNAAINILQEGVRLALQQQSPSGSDYDGRKRPPQTGNTLDTCRHSDSVSTSDLFCRSER